MYIEIRDVMELKIIIMTLKNNINLYYKLD